MQKDGKKHIAILGSTGSIGRQTLDVISQHPDLFEVELLTANTNSALLIEQARAFNPNSVVICDESHYQEVFEALDKDDIKVYAGMDSVCDIVSDSTIDVVVASMVGFAGLRSAVAAIEAGKTVALANKETLVAAGSLVMSLAARHGASIVPVDSEHSAIFQCLQGNYGRDVEKLLLTCSGGPFLHKSKDEIARMTPQEALKHPRWNMGAKVTIDSASLMNKGLEMIEARWLFDMPAERIEVVVHPESILHGAVPRRRGDSAAERAGHARPHTIRPQLSATHRAQREQDIFPPSGADDLLCPRHRPLPLPGHRPQGAGPGRQRGMRHECRQRSGSGRIFAGENPVLGNP